MSWIKMRTDLWDDPRVSAICDKLDTSEATIVGALFRFWSIADQHSVDGLLTTMTPSSLDRKVGLDAFSKALEQVGWLIVDSDGLRVPRFAEHNGESAKTRARNAKNQSHRRSVTDLSPETGDGTVMPRVPTEESESEKESETETETEGFAKVIKPKWPELKAFDNVEKPQLAVRQTVRVVRVRPSNP